MDCWLCFAVRLSCLGLVLAASPGQGCRVSAGEVFHARDFGAVPDDGSDAAPGIRAAIAAARAAGPGAEVVLDAGVYTLNSEGEGNVCFPLNECDGLVLRGQGTATELVHANPRHQTFHLSGCRNTTVKDFVVDYNPPPFTQGTIVAVDAASYTFDYELQPGFPSLTEPWFAECPEPYGRWGMLFDREERRLKTNAPDHVFMTSWEHVEGRVWRMHPAPGQDNKFRAMAPGDPFVYMARSGGTIVFFHGCTDCMVENIVIHASPGLAMALVGNEQVTVRGVKILFREGTDRLLTTDADGVHCQQNRKGPIIEDCLFEGMADDSINIYCPPNVVLEAVSPTELVVRRHTRMRDGDRIQIYDARVGRMVGEVIADKVVEERGTYRLTLSEPVEGVTPGTDHRDADCVYNMSASGAGFIIRNNTFRLHRRHGIYLRAGGGLVEGNTIDRVAGFGISISNEPDWPEGPVPWGITVRNNTIKGVGYAAGYTGSPHGAGIQAQSAKLGHGPAQDRAAHDFAFEDNTIIDPPGSGFYLGALTGAVLRGNRIVYPDHPRTHDGAAPVIVTNADGVIVDGLRIESATPVEPVVRVLDASPEPQVSGVEQVTP